MEFMGIHHDLIEGSVPEGQRLTLFNPCSCRLGGSDIDLVLAGSGDGRCQPSEDVLFIELVNESLVPLCRDQVAAVCIVAFLKDIADLMKVGPHGSKEVHRILVGSPASKGCVIYTGTRLIGDGPAGRLTQLLLHLHPTLLTLNRCSEVIDVGFHLVIGGTVLCRHRAIFHGMGVEKLLCRLPCRGSLRVHFLNIHNSSPP